MTDLEIIRLCADAMGITILPSWTYCESRHVRCRTKCQKPKECEPMCGECAVAELSFGIGERIKGEYYDPFHDDAQAFALVKKMRIGINAWNPEYQVWIQNRLISEEESGKSCTFNADLNRAICECVAKMQAAK